MMSRPPLVAMGRSRGDNDRVRSSGAGRSFLRIDGPAPARGGDGSAALSASAIARGPVVTDGAGFSADRGSRSRQPITTSAIATQLTAAHLPHDGHLRCAVAAGDFGVPPGDVVGGVGLD